MKFLKVLFLFVFLFVIAGCMNMSAPSVKHKFGLLPDKPDATMQLWQLPKGAKTVIPQNVDLRQLFPPVYDQGQLGSCTANALAAVVDYIKRQQGQQFIYPSRLFIYYNERAAEGTVSQDAGASLQDGVKALMRLGVCPENIWIYDISKFAVKPSGAAYVAAMDYQALQYAKIPDANLLLIKQTLANHYPIAFGFTVYASFESASVAKSGICPMPKHGEQVLGGHAVVLCGYNEATQMFLVRNSWGDQWGIQGYFWMPYSFLQKYATGFWVIKKVE